MQTAKEFETALSRQSDPVRAEHSLRFFKTGPGQYGEGDKFFGATVPQVRKIVSACGQMPVSEIQKLIESSWHEARLGACLILVMQYKKADVDKRQKIYDFYLNHAKRINNWDLVDTSAPHIVGRQLVEKGDWSILKKLARSKNIWEKRIAMLATMAFSDSGDSAPTYAIAEILIDDDHDLIHKAVGWMLREAGKRVSEQELELWLGEDGRYKTMPRTMLRYTIERLPETKRQQYLRGEI